MPIPTGIKKVITPLSILLFFGVIWFGLYEPQLTRSKEYRGKLKELEQQLDSIMRQVGSYEPPTPEETDEWQRLANELERRIPRERRVTELYAFISDLAQKNRLGNFDRRVIEGSENEFEEDGIKRSSFDLELTFDGEYHTLVRFLAGLRSLDRLVEVDKLEVIRKPPLVGVRIVLRSYYSS